MDSATAIISFRNLLSSIQPSCKQEFLTWMKRNIGEMCKEAESPDNADVMIEAIREDIRATLPVDATSSTESFLVPTQGSNSDCDPQTTAHVDSFLYDEDEVDEMCDEGKMSMNYCTQCGSRNIKPLTFITHSASLKQIKYLFKYLLPDLSSKTVVDVGSRTGAILYGAYLYSGASRVIGVEIDPTFCQLQQRIIKSYDMEDRIQVLHQDVRNCSDLLKSADVIILNNVFEFFMPAEEQLVMWQFLQQTIQKPGTLLVTIPSIEKSFENLQINMNLHCWLKPVDTSEICKKAGLVLLGDEDSDDETLRDIFFYEVLQS